MRGIDGELAAPGGERTGLGLTTLCLKPFMAAAGTDARQAVRRSGGEKGPSFGGVALEASAVQSQLNGANAVRTENAHARCIATGREAGLRSTWETDACRDRSSLVLEVVVGAVHGGRRRDGWMESSRAEGDSRPGRGSGRATHTHAMGAASGMGERRGCAAACCGASGPHQTAMRWCWLRLAALTALVRSEAAAAVPMAKPRRAACNAIAQRLWLHGDGGE